MIDYEKRAMIEAEDKYTFRQSSQISSQTGLIGYLRADMDTDGNGFFSSWNDYRKDLKTNAYPTAITQNVEYLLDSVQASTMLSNSEFVIMLNQAASDREKLARLLNISNEQMSYITNADAGCGLIKYGSALVPFINQFPHDTKLYQLMTTRPGEGEFARGQD